MSTTKPAHTPTPWNFEVPPSSQLTTRQIVGPNREPVASVGLPQGYSCGTFADVANAALIVRAVNSHAELVAALEAMLAPMDGMNADAFSSETAARIKAARAALAKAQA